MAVQMLSEARIRGARPSARLSVRPAAGTSRAVTPARKDAAPFPRDAVRPGTEAAQHGTDGRWLSDVDAWALPFDLACGGSGAPASRAARGDTYEVWS
ncbi:hypothetical protein [Bordetella sp. N]|uniref:hypothetical protein n=1 Tax=Bordetella sp. N TaxID=1746199 RepID=UPI00070F721D|nr:hypothetical protein [Bordetella sp. N]ALM84345.1 hypothetical protein ASB57_16445 [Bordetella sp. N]